MAKREKEKSKSNTRATFQRKRGSSWLKRKSRQPGRSELKKRRSISKKWKQIECEWARKWLQQPGFRRSKKRESHWS